MIGFRRARAAAPWIRALLGAAALAFAAFAALPALATVTVNKQFTPATIDPGDVSVLRISFFNSSLVPLTAAAVTDNLPAQIAIANPPGINDTCGFATVTAVSGAQRITTVGGTVPAGTGTMDGSCYIEVNVVSTTAGNWPNTIPANGPTNGFTPGGTTSGFQATENTVTVTNTTPATATLSVRGLSNPTVNKTFAPSPGLQGDPITLTITLTNPNTLSTIPLTSFTDPLPAGMVVATTPSETVNCTGTGAVNGTANDAAGSSSVTLTGGVIGMAGTCVVTVNVVVAAIAGTTQTFSNTVPANAIGNTRGLGSAAFTRTEVVNSPITVAKAFVTASGGNTAIANPIPVNSVFWLRIDITNASTLTTLNLTSFVDTFPTVPSGMQTAAGTPVVDCVTNGGGTNGSIVAPAGAGSFSAGATSFELVGGSVGTTGSTRRCRIYVPVTLTAAGTFVNTIPANAVGNSNGFNSPTASATANANAQLTVAKTVSPSSAAPGQPVTFTITINNYSGGAVTGVTLNDTLPIVLATYQMVIATPNNFSASAGCVGGTFGNTPGSSALTWTSGTIAAGSGLSPGVCTIKFNAVAPANTPVGQTFTNAIPAGSITGTGGGGGVGNTNAASVNVLMVAAASVTKAFSPSSVALGGTSTLTVTLSNQTGASLTNAAIADNLPSGVVVAPTPATSTTCTGGTVTATAGGSSVSLSGATVPTAGCNFKVNVVGNTLGAHANSIPANSLTNDQNATNPSAANATLTVTGGLTATKAFNPTSVASGGVSQVTIHFANTASVPFTNLSVTDGPMTNLVVATPAAASTTCAGTPVITAAPGTATVTMTGATLAAGANCDLLFNVKTSGNPTNWPNNLPIGAITTAEGVQNAEAVNATLGKLTAVSIGINKSFNPVSVSAGQPSTLQIDLVNPVASPTAVHNVSVSDNFPVGMEVYATPNVSTTCTNATVTANPGTAIVKITGATIPIGATCSVFVQVTSTKFLNLTNTIPAGAVTSTEGLTNALATSATLSTLQGLGVTKAFSPTSVSLGQVSTMQLRLLSTLDPNAATPVTLHNVSFTDNLPAGLSVAPVPNTSTTCTGGTVVATAGSGLVTVSGFSLPPGTNCFIYVDVLASSLGVYTNTIPAGAMTSTEGYSNPTAAQAVLNVLPPPTVTKSFSPSSVTPGTPSTATIVIHNNSATVTLHNVAFVDTLPGGLAVAPTPNATASCGGGSVSAPASGSTISLTNGVIAPNADCTVQVDVRSNSPGSYVNTITAGSISTAEGVSNPVDSSGTLSVLGPPNVVKSFTPNAIGAGGTSHLAIQLGNPNPSAATLTSAFIDVLPANVVVAATPNTGASTCTQASIFAAPGGSTVTYASGATIPAGGCEIDVDVTSSVVGAYTNTIAANALATNLGSNASATSAQLTVLAVPTLAKDISPANIAVGGTAILTLTLGNSNAVPITLTAAFTDTMPPGVTTTSGNTGTCLSNVTVAATSISVANGTQIPPGGCTIVVTITSTTPGTVTNQTSSLATNAGTAPFASAPLTVSGLPTLAKAIVPGTIAIGDSATLTITIGNPNPVAIALTSDFTDGMPPGVTITSGNSGTCTSGITLTASSIAMASGTSIPPPGCTIVVTITSNTPGGVTNTTSALATNVGGAPQASATLTVTAVAPTLGKSIAPSAISVGGSTLLTLTLGNPNNVPITLGADFIDNMPAGVTTIGGNTGSCVGVSVASTSITMPAGSTIQIGGCTIVVTLTSSTPGSYTNTTGTLTTNAGNAPQASAGLVVAALPSLAKTIVAPTIAIGGTSTLTLTLGNANAAPILLTGAFTDTMPGGVTIVGGTGGNCPGVSNTSTVITMAAGSAIPNGGCTITATLSSSTPGTFTNTTSALATTTGTAPAASAPLTVTAVSSALGKAIVPSTIVAGTSATLTITLGNTNAIPITLTSAFIDTMPGGVTITGGTGGTCTGTSNTSTVITMASGSTIPVGGCTIVVAITSATPGTVTNTTSSLVTSAGTTTPASAPLTVTAAIPTLGKTIVPATIAVGGSATLTITIGNVNATAVTLTSAFTDAMPAGVTTTSSNKGTCQNVTVGSTSITMASGTAVPPGGCTIVVTVTSSTPGTVNNTTGSLVTDAGTAPPATAPVTVTATAPTLAKTIVPASIAVGGTATLTITIGNSNAVPMTLTAAFTDSMPPGVTTIGPNSGTCAGAVVALTSVTLPSGTTVPVGGCTIIVPITSSTRGSVTNTTSALTTGFGGAPPASAPLTVVPSSVGLAKTIAPSSIATGGTATLTIRLSNAGPSPVTLTSAFVDTMPAGVTTTGGNTGTCTGVAATSTSVTMASGSSLPPGGCTIVVAITSSTPGTVTNTTGSLDTSGGSALPASAPLRVTVPGPTLAKAIAPSTIAAGGTATLTLTLGNTGSSPLTLASAFVDTMPAGVTTTSGNAGTCTGVSVTPTIVTMASGSTIPPGGCSIVVTITSSTPGTVTNVTGPLATNGGTAPPASAPLTVNALGPTLTKAIAPATIAPGGTATLTLALGNTGSSPLTLTAAFVDNMPAGVTTTSGNTGTCAGVSVASTTITMASGSTIPPGGCTIVVTITSSTPGTVTNTTGPLATSGGTAPPGSAPITVSGGAGPTLTKAIVPSTISPGGTATLTLALGNAGSSPVTLTSAFVDTMPAGVTTTSGNTGTCTGVSITATTITMASGSTIPPGGCTIVVTITSSTPGTVTNTTGPLNTSGGGAPPASAPITVSGTGATLTKAIVPALIEPGGTATLTIALGNATASPLVLGAPFTDPMPGGMTTTTGNTGTCAGVTVTPTLITMPTGASIPSGGCTIVVGVTSSSPGTLTNVTSALVTTKYTAPSASAPLGVAMPGSTQPIPVDSKVALALCALLIVLTRALRRRRR
jgi:uncharacterized repeat protein (TIGR01451 family)